MNEVPQFLQLTKVRYERIAEVFQVLRSIIKLAVGNKFLVQELEIQDVEVRDQRSSLLDFHRISYNRHLKGEEEMHNSPLQRDIKVILERASEEEVPFKKSSMLREKKK